MANTGDQVKASNFNSLFTTLEAVRVRHRNANGLTDAQRAGLSTAYSGPAAVGATVVTQNVGSLKNTIANLEDNSPYIPSGFNARIALPSVGELLKAVNVTIMEEQVQAIAALCANCSYFSSNYSSNFSSNFSSDYSSNFSSNFNSDYSSNYSSNFNSNFSSDYSSNFNSNFSSDYSSNFNSNYSSNYSSNFSSDYSSNFNSNFSSNYSRQSSNYSSNFGSNFSSNYSRQSSNYGSNFAAFRNGVKCSRSFLLEIYGSLKYRK